jgi:hypothetical protein
MGNVRRIIIVGKDLLWVFDNTPATIPVIEKFSDWECKNLLSIYRELELAGEPNPTKACQVAALAALDLHWPTSSKDVSDSFKKK